MRKWPVFIILLLGILTQGGLAKARGYLFIIGGGDRPGKMMRRFVELAGRFGSGKIVIFPMASSVPAEAGPEIAAEFKSCGAREAEYHVLTRDQALKEESVAILNNVGGVYFSGGVQSRQMDVLRDTPIHRKLRDLYEKGCVIGGTSAGAAVMSEVMITGEERKKVGEDHQFETIEAANVITVEGFGFLKTAIIDQHFATRKRHNRLISLVAEKPQLLGIGIDESTAIIVNPGEVFDVVGEKNVVIYDASKAKIKITTSRAIGLTGMRMDILLPGDSFDLKARKVMRQRRS